MLFPTRFRRLLNFTLQVPMLIIKIIHRWDIQLPFLASGYHEENSKTTCVVRARGPVCRRKQLRNGGGQR